MRVSVGCETLRRIRVLLALLAAVTLLLTACGGGSAASDTTESPGGSLPVFASFYPLEYAAAQVGGPHVTVFNLTKPGTEPHDAELSPKELADLSKASVVFYAKGFQPAVDEAVAQRAQHAAFDVAPVAHLDVPAAVESGTPPGGTDPHFWLDPQRYAAVATAVGERLAAVDPPNAADYRVRSARFTEALATLDRDFATGTRGCRMKALVTSHAAFGYLAQRYGFTQVPISGLDPAAEPSAGKLTQVADYVRAHGVTTIYAETLVDPAVAQTIAQHTGATVALLDPVEGLTDRSPGRNYLEIMRANLTALRAGQGCP